MALRGSGRFNNLKAVSEITGIQSELSVLKETTMSSTFNTAEWPATYLLPGAIWSGGPRQPPHSQSHDCNCKCKQKSMQTFPRSLAAGGLTHEHVIEVRARGPLWLRPVRHSQSSWYFHTSSENGVNKKSTDTPAALRDGSEGDQTKGERTGHAYWNNSSVKRWHAEGYL